MTEQNNQENKSKKHLLILGAGASMSLVPEIKFENFMRDYALYKNDEDAELPINQGNDFFQNFRLPSGAELVRYISSYNNELIKKCIEIDKNRHETNTQNQDESHDSEELYIELSQMSLTKLLKEFTKYYNEMVLPYVRYLCIASYLVKKYTPMSIDYFANNLYFFATNEIELLISEKIFENKDNAIKIIQKYLKLIIFEILSQKQKSTIEYASNHADYNYIRHMIWNLTLEANRIDPTINPKKYIEDNLDIITFNYDITTEVLLRAYNDIITMSYAEIINGTILHDDKVNIIHVYSHLYAKEGEPLKMSYGENKVTYDTINIVDLLFSDLNGTQNLQHIDELLNESDYYINWIRANQDKESQHLTNVCKTLFEKAHNVYFLGFGFDKNNLNQVGFTRNNQKLNEKKYFVCRGDGNVIAKLENILYDKYGSFQRNGSLDKFEHVIQKRNGSDTVFFYKSKRRDGVFYDEIQISMSDIDTAFKTDFEI